MSILHFRYKERRRTVRVMLNVPLKIHGHTETGEKFVFPTQSQTVSLHGVSFAFDAPVVLGQVLKLENENTREAIEGKVVAIRHARDGKTYIGMEFTTAKNFWHMAFPVPGARPMRRPISSKVISA